MRERERGERVLATSRDIAMGISTTSVKSRVQARERKGECMYMCAGMRVCVRGQAVSCNSNWWWGIIAIFEVVGKALDLGPCGCRSQQCQPLCFWLGELSSITQFSVKFWHDGPLLVYYCHGLSCSTSGLLLSCFIMLRFRFTTVTGPLHVYYMSRS